MSDETPDMDIIELDLTAENITEALRSAPLFRKKVVVQARPAAAGEQIRTVLANGTEETVNTAQAGDIIITNPGGEQYIMKFDKFTARYDALDEEGNYRAKGVVRAIPNPTGKQIQVMAPWGEAQFGDQECVIASPYEPTDPDTVSLDRYIIGRLEFQDTYEPVERSVVSAAEPTLTEDAVAQELIDEMPQPGNRSA